MKRILLLVYVLVAYDIGWFACAIGASRGWGWLGPAVILPLVGIHLLLAERRRAEAAFLLACGVIGAVLDTLLAAGAGVLSFQAWEISAKVAPLWLFALWMMFGTLFSRALSWMRGKPWFSAPFGAVAGPAAYYAGARFDALTLHEPLVFSLTILALVWAGVFPLLVWLHSIIVKESEHGSHSTEDRTSGSK